MIDFLLRPFRRNFGKDKLFYAAIDDMFGFIPNNIELYKLALIHKSASVVTDDGRQINNERLEYLGDAVIETVTSDYLFIEYPDMNEGFLTQLRSKMVSRQTLNEVAKRIGLDGYVISHTSASMSQKHIFGDAFEAMMGAIYLDQGYEFVNRLLINKIFANYIKADNLAEAETDFKSRLIEWCQKNHHTIRFSTHNDKNYSAAHPFFYCKVLIDNIEVGYGAGDSKKEAEQRAAYSVAQGVSDADYTKLMDRLDTLESKQLLRAQSQQPQQPSQSAEKQKSAEKSQEAKSQDAKPQKEEKHQPQTVKKQEEVKPKEQESAMPEKRAAEPKAESLAEATAAASPEPAAKARRNRSRKSEEDQPTAAENNVASQETPLAEEEKQLAKRASARKPKAKKAGEKSAEPNKPEQEEQSADVAKPAKEKSAKPVAEKAAKAENTDKALSREIRADKGEKSAKRVKENLEKPEKSDESEKSEKPEKSARAKRSRSRKKSASEAEQSLNNIAEDVNALMAEVKKLTKEGV